jgi:hypothetical protein
MTASPASPNASDPALRVGQCAGAVMMIRPASFGWNAETQGSNRFQSRAAVPGRLAADLARAEFDAVAGALRDAGVVVHAFADRAEPVCPDAVFPNNWVSFHADGTAVLYPMLAPSRRLERRPELLQQLADRNAFDLSRVVDLTHFEDTSEYLEGTGSLVLDRIGRVAYACLSPRTHRGPLEAFCARLGYEPFAFEATDAAGIPVYHTNVVLSLGSALAIVAIGNVVAADRGRLLARLSAGGRHVECIDTGQTANFAANALELRDAAAASVLAMSARAWASFSPDARARLANCVDRRVIVPIPTIEALGGGSVRCMLAEVFNPPEEAG